MENLKEIAASAIEKAAGYIEDRENLYCKLNELTNVITQLIY